MKKMRITQQSIDGRTFTLTTERHADRGQEYIISEDGFEMVTLNHVEAEIVFSLLAAALEWFDYQTKSTFQFD